jgi:hypothetical protein
MLFFRLRSGCCLIFILLLLSSKLLVAQANFPYAGYTKCSWEGITCMDSSFRSSDSSLIIVSTRNALPGATLRTAFLGTEIAADSLLRYYTIYFNGNNWKAVPRRTLADALDASGGQTDYAVYTEGDGKTFPKALDRATRLSRLYGANVIMFDWPTQIPGARVIHNVHNTVRNSKKLGKQYHTLLLLLKSYKSQHPAKIAHLSLFFHSLGNAVFKNSVEKCGSMGFEGLADDIILNAACVPAFGHRRWIEKLAFNCPVYIIFNRKDKTLRAASLLFHKRFLGCQLNHRHASNAVYVNIHSIAMNKHNYFLILPLLNEHPQIKDFFYSLLHGQSPPFTNEYVFRLQKKNRIYTFL